MPHNGSGAPAALAVSLAYDPAVAPVVGTIVNVAGRHDKALQYAESLFRCSPLVPDSHGGHLRVQTFLARGDWSVVYRVTEVAQRANAAVKIIPQQGTHILSYYEDIGKLSTLKHPNIIRLHNHFVFEQDDSPCPLLCLRLELCKCSLEQYIRHQRQRQRPIPIAHICVYITQIASALAYIHGRGLLHGDVSSTNVLLAPGASASGPLAVRLTNLGSSQRTGKPGAPPLTVTGGSRAYVPLEWARHTAPGRPLTALETPLPSYDLWGLGCVLSEVATLKTMADERLLHGDSLATDPCCLAALRQEMAAVHGGTLTELCGALLREDPDDRPEAKAVPLLLPAPPLLPLPPRSGCLALARPANVSGLLRYFAELGRRRRHPLPA